MVKNNKKEKDFLNLYKYDNIYLNLREIIKNSVDNQNFIPVEILKENKYKIFIKNINLDNLLYIKQHLPVYTGSNGEYIIDVKSRIIAFINKDRIKTEDGKYYYRIKLIPISEDTRKYLKDHYLFALNRFVQWYIVEKNKTKFINSYCFEKWGELIFNDYYTYLYYNFKQKFEKTFNMTYTYNDEIDNHVEIKSKVFFNKSLLGLYRDEIIIYYELIKDLINFYKGCV